MGWYERTFQETVTYWAPGTPDGYGGMSFADPVKIKARWEQRTELFRDSQGEEVRSMAVVYLGQDVEKGGYLYQGYTKTKDPTTLGDAWEIRQFRKQTDLAGKVTERKAWL